MNAQSSPKAERGAASPSHSTVAFEHFNAPVSMEYDEAASKALGADYWRVTQGFRYYFSDPTGSTYVDIPVGYLSDGASIPRLFWDLLPPWGAYGQAAVLHDYLCENLYYIKDGVKTPMTRVKADDELRDAMVILEVPRWKRNVIFICVALYAKVCRIKGPVYAKGKQAYLEAYPTIPIAPIV